MDSLTQQVDPLVMRSQTRVGTVLQKKWRLDSLLGVGGMAAVYAATRVTTGQRVAVKILHPELSLQPEMRSRFKREGYAANAVAHDDCVKVLYDDVAEDGSLFLVMELLDGETLEDRQTRLGGRLSEEEVLSIADQVLDVLAAAHAHSVLHRDLKPSNIFITRAGRAKILDLGIARLKEMSTQSSATKTGVTMGTPAFMPPEQARGAWSDVDVRSDVWAVGATMFTLIGGVFVHGDGTQNEQLVAAMTKHAPPLATAVPGVSAAVA